VIRLILADDHRIILEGLEQLFRRERDFQVMATCTNGADALVAVRHHKPDVLVLDYQMPHGDGLSTLKAVRAENLNTRVVLLTATMDEDDVLDAMQAGVHGLVLKESAAVMLVNCVRRVAAGQRVLDESMVNRALDRMAQRQDVSNTLSVRETEIVKMVASGLRNKEIAGKLSIGEGTVKSHLHTIYEKLGVHGRVELTLYAQERGIV
jgi:two-component system nitrate/nitrite response regulator NarP